MVTSSLAWQGQRSRRPGPPGMRETRPLRTGHSGPVPLTCALDSWGSGPHHKLPTPDCSQSDMVPSASDTACPSCLPPRPCCRGGPACAGVSPEKAHCLCLFILFAAFLRNQRKEEMVDSAFFFRIILFLPEHYFRELQRRRARDKPPICCFIPQWPQDQ